MTTFTVLLSTARLDNPAVREVESALTSRLRDDLGADVVIVPDLIDLEEDDPALEAVRSVRGPLIVLAWMYPRAAYWLLARAGVEGIRVDADAALPETGPRAIVPVDMRGVCCADGIFERVAAFAAPAAPPQAGAVTRFDRAVEERWYPVIDYDRCVNCLECLEFCLFGVYDEDGDGRPVVAEPDRCKPGCPACARVCPEHAIIFPRHPTTPAIAGADEGDIEPLSAETVRRDGIIEQCADAAAQYLRAGRPCACANPAACAGPGDKRRPPDLLDRAIDELDASEV